MKLNKKIILVSAAALMALSPAIALTQNNEPVFAASKKATKKTIKTSVNGITLYNEKGNFYTGKKKVKSNSTIKTYGKPVWITSRISLLSSDSFPIIRINNGQNYVWLGDNGYIKSNCLGSISNKGVINIARKGYVYDKNGKRLKSYRGGKATVTRNQKIKYAGKLTETSRELYYYVGSGAYVKALNVSKINGQYVFTKQPTYVVPRADMYVLNKDLKETSKAVRAGSKVKIDQVLIDTDYTDPQLYVRIAGTKDQFLYWTDAGDYPDEDEGNFSFRFFMDDNHNFAESTQSLVTFKQGLEKTTPLYNDQGQLVDLGGKYLEKAARGNFLPENNYQVDYARYIWVPSEKKAELFYHLIGTTFSMRDPHSKYEYTWVKQNVGSVYVKASDVTFKGLKVKTQNTAEEATKLAEKQKNIEALSFDGAFYVNKKF